MRTRQVVEGLRAAAAFREMGARELAMIACGGKPRRLPRYAACSTRGQLLLTMIAITPHTVEGRYAVLYREGTAAHSFYILTSGCLEASSLGGGGATRRLACPAGGRGLVLGTEGLAGLPRQESTFTLVSKYKSASYSRCSVHRVPAASGGTVLELCRRDTCVLIFLLVLTHCY